MRIVCMCSFCILSVMDLIFTILNAVIISLWASFFVFASSVCFIRIKHCHRKLYQVRHIPNNSNHRNVRCMMDYLAVQSETMQFLFNMNKLVGNVMLFYFIPNIPLNSTLIMQVAYKNFSFGFKVTLGVIIIQQLTILICVHWIGTLYVSRIQKVNQQLAMLYYNTNKIKLKKHLKLSSFIQNWHTTKPIGMTYGSVGVITMMAFVKVSVNNQCSELDFCSVSSQSMYIYVRFLMFNYVNVRLQARQDSIFSVG